MALTKVSYSMINGTPVNILDYGAVSNQNSTSAITAAEAAAYASGQELYFPAGTYLYEGQFTCRVSVTGYGSTLKQNSSTPSVNALLNYSNTSNVTVRGLTIDGNSASRGLLFSSSSNIRVNDVVVKNTVFGANAYYDCSDIEISNCTSDGVVPLIDTGTGLAYTAGDGFYLSACTNARIANCFAKDFSRIGFVTEGNASGAKSDYIVIANCQALDAKNADSYVAEWNAGFWSENTRNVDYVNCMAINISSGVGQTSKRVAGFVIGGYENGYAQQNFVNCQVVKNTVDIPYGFKFSGGDTGVYGKASINTDNIYVDKCSCGIVTDGGMQSLTIKNLKLSNLNASTAVMGGVLLDISAKGLPTLTIDGLEYSSSTLHNDSGEVNFFSNDTALTYTLSNAKNIRHVMRNPCNTIEVKDSSVSYGCDTYQSFMAQRVRFNSGFYGYPRRLAKDWLFNTGGITDPFVVFDVGCELSTYDSLPVRLPVTGVDCNIIANGARFNWTAFDVSTTGTFSHIFTGCFITHSPATNGFYRANYNSPTKQVLQVTGCRFISDAVGNTPFIKWTNDPTASVFQANTYNTTALYNFGTGVTQANNTNI